jgi:peroxiredoxin family protein
MASRYQLAMVDMLLESPDMDGFDLYAMSSYKQWRNDDSLEEEEEEDVVLLLACNLTKVAMGINRQNVGDGCVREWRVE